MHSFFLEATTLEVGHDRAVIRSRQDPKGTMTMRSCTDRAGTRWEIFEVHPGGDGRAVERMPEAFRAGWLCFQSLHERRRLALVPLGWADWSDHELLGALPYGHCFERRTPPEFRLPPNTSGSHERQT